MLVGGAAVLRSREDPALLKSRPAGDDPVVLVAGDIADCQTDEDEEVAQLLDGLQGTVLALGDNAYDAGTIDEYRRCYEPTWGRHKERTRPVPGNHDYKTPQASGYFAYFGAAAGERGKGYYAFDIGEHWRAIALNSNCRKIAGGCKAGSPQESWLRAELEEHSDKNVLAYWHHARFSSGYHGNNKDVAPLWEALYEAGADIILNAHDHDYERFAPQNPDGEPEESGVRQFVVGTGGGPLREYFPSPPQAATEVRDADHSGVLRLVLHPDSYHWEFISVGEQGFSDRGSGPVVEKRI
jgi:acid phosphatase type 7